MIISTAEQFEKWLKYWADHGWYLWYEDEKQKWGFVRGNNTRASQLFSTIQEAICEKAKSRNSDLAASLEQNRNTAAILQRQIEELNEVYAGEF